MKKIYLTKGKDALVDDDDYERISKLHWQANEYGIRGDFRAVSAIYKAGTPHKIIYMHRVIMGLEKGDKRTVDHIDHNGLNNQKANLRICSFRENCRNMRRHQDNTSMKKGVYRYFNKYLARIWDGTRRKNLYLGSFNSVEEAHTAYCKAARKLFGTFACPD